MALGIRGDGRLHAHGERRHKTVGGAIDVGDPHTVISLVARLSAIDGIAVGGRPWNRDIVLEPLIGEGRFARRRHRESHRVSLLHRLALRLRHDARRKDNAEILVNSSGDLANAIVMRGRSETDIEGVRKS